MARRHAILEANAAEEEDDGDIGEDEKKMKVKNGLDGGKKGDNQDLMSETGLNSHMMTGGPNAGYGQMNGMGGMTDLYGMSNAMRGYSMMGHGMGAP